MAGAADRQRGRHRVEQGIDDPAEVSGLEPTREYDLPAIHNLRISPRPEESGKRNQLGGLDGGVIAFDYGAGTIRFGAGIDEAEAATVIGELKTRFLVLAKAD